MRGSNEQDVADDDIRSEYPALSWSFNRTNGSDDYQEREWELRGYLGIKAVVIAHGNDINELLEKPCVRRPPVTNDVFEYGKMVAEQPKTQAKDNEESAKRDLFDACVWECLANGKNARNAIGDHERDAGKDGVRMAKRESNDSYEHEWGGFGSLACVDFFADEVHKENYDCGHEAESGDVRIDGTKSEKLPGKCDKGEGNESPCD